MAPLLRLPLGLLAVSTCTLLGLASACGSSGASDAAAPTALDPPASAAEPAPPPATAVPAPSPSAPPDAGAPVPALVTCGPLASACAPTTPVSGLFATYRKDAYLSESEYPEPGVPPTSGGRVHVAGIASIGGAVTAVRINGVLVDDLLTQTALDWYHVWPRVAVAGEPIWVAFHSRSPSWDSATTASVTVETATGAALSGSFAIKSAAVPLRYVTTADDGKTLLVHAVNTAAAPRTISRLVVDGRDVTAAACIPKKTLAPGEHALITVPRCTAEKAGAAWTVTLELADGSAATGVGRVLKEQFPIEAWPRKADCALPGGNAASLAKHQSAGVDTLYMYFAVPGCNLSGSTLVNSTLPSLPKKYSVLVGDDFLDVPSPETQITDTRAVAGFLTGDESDGEYLVDGYPAPERKARDSRRLWQMYPGLPTYNGGKTNKKVGAFAGMADIQGMDFYVAACAPHITNPGSRMPVRGAYDYLRNTRDNHAPLPTWLYAQGLHDGWNKKAFGATVHVQPDRAEILVQAMSVAAAGGKGLMWFQTDLSEAAVAPASWDAIAHANQTFRAVRGWLREGDPTGLASAGKQSALVEAIRARDAIVVPIINLAVTSEPNDVECAKIYIGSPVPHFAFVTQTTEVRVRVPDDFSVGDVFEVDGTAVKNAPSYTIAGRELRFAVQLGQTSPVRMLVLARDTSARGLASSNAQ